jgi:hypothetical protein
MAHSGHVEASKDVGVDLDMVPHTSKLASFANLSSILTFGFHGEALSSLHVLAEGVTITTVTTAQAPMGTILIFNSAGHLTSSSGNVACQVCFYKIINGFSFIS